MKKYLKPILLLLVAGSIFSSCKKDSKQSNTDKLCGKNWKITAETVNPGVDLFGTGTLITDLYAQTTINPDCVKDNFITFKSDGTYTQDEGGTKCDVADPQTIAGTWTWNSEETVLTLVEQGSSDAYSFTIVTNDGSTLSGTSLEIFNGITYTITTTYKKQ